MFSYGEGLFFKIKTYEHTFIQTEIGWKTFIPPIPQHTGRSKGWFLFCDILVCMPLSLFLQVVCLNYKLEGFDEFVNHPIRKHYLIKNLPDSLKKQLVYRRKYISSTYEDIQRLAYMGLVQFGDNIYKEKDKAFAYVNTKAKLLDTRTSVKGMAI